MPTTYAHDRFGREVWKKLPKDLKETIRKHKKLYLIGLHGPDIFFYYHPLTKNPISEYGSELHRRTAEEFFRERIAVFQENPDDSMRVYLLGFACHFLLDSTCHPYINAFEDQTGISHAEIETHLDRALMEMDGKDPFRYEPASSICPNTPGNRVIQRCFPRLSQEEILECLKGMKFYTHLPICRNEIKRAALLGALKLSGHYDAMEGQIMRKKPNPKCETATTNLLTLYRKAVSEAPGELEGLNESILTGAPLSGRFRRNFD